MKTPNHTFPIKRKRKRSDKSPYTKRNVKRTTQHNDVTKKFDYTTIADRLGWSDGRTSVIQLVWLTELRAQNTGGGSW